jgi:cytochrome b561
VTATNSRAIERYGSAAVALHWITALLILANLLLGISMVPLPLSIRKLHWYSWHKWIGTTVFLLTCARLLSRTTHAAPPAVAMPVWQQHAATFSHTLLYVLMLVIPLSGWLYSSSTGVQVVYLGLVPLPDLVPKDRELAATLKAVHVSLNVTMVLMVVVHAAAAVKHHFVDRDEVLVRMWPRLKRKESV